MKLTPLDIHHKEFGHALRGYNEEQVDAFLDEVADEFERLFKENIDLSEKLEAANERVRGYQQIENSINATLVQAQRSSEEIVAEAGHDADSVLRDAELKAKEIIHGALQKKQTIGNELVRIKRAEEDFRARYKALLEEKLRLLSEVALPDDVSLLLGETEDGVVGAVQVREEVAEMTAPAAASAVVSAVATEPEPLQSTLETIAEGETAPHTFDIEAPADLDQSTVEMPPVEPPVLGFVSSVSLGEIESPEIEPEIELIEPAEFDLPGIQAFGDREDDHDIEEID